MAPRKLNERAKNAKPCVDRRIAKWDARVPYAGGGHCNRESSEIETRGELFSEMNPRFDETANDSAASIEELDVSFFPSSDRPSQYFDHFSRAATRCLNGLFATMRGALALQRGRRD
jgi:hypothetical protein